MAPRVALGFYNAVLLALSPLLMAKKAAKYRAHRERHEIDLARWRAPQALDEARDETGLRVVFVALSWGEVTLLDHISRRLEADFTRLHIVWALRNAADAERARSAFPTRTLTTMPFDFVIPVRHWLRAVRPDVLIVVEKFWWPNLVWGARQNGARVVLINGRSRGRDRARYRLMSSFQAWVLGAFDLLLFESDVQIARVRDVLPRGAHVMATGNIKFAFASPSPPGAIGELEKWIDADNNRALPLLIAGSTSSADEKWALEAWQKVNSEIPCRLLLAPRRIERAGAIADRLQNWGLAASRRSETQNHAAPILILDTLGELAFVYRFGVAAYVGGAIEGRGHNIIEPLSWGKPVAYGPQGGDFEAVQRVAEAAGVGFRLHSSVELAQFWKQALLDQAWRGEIESKAAQLLRHQRGALDAVVAQLALEIETFPKKPFPTE